MHPSRSAITRSWNSNARVWADAVRAHALESRRLVTDAAVVAAVMDQPGRRVLDVGCGEGWLAAELARRGCDVVGFDGSRELIDVAREHDSASFLLLDYDEFAREPARAGTGFGTAICNFSILADDVAPLLSAIRSVVHATGHLVIQTVHPMAPHDGGYADGWREETFENLPGEWSPMPWYFRTVGSWIRELRAAGWLIDEVREPLHPETKRPASLILIAG